MNITKEQFFDLYGKMLQGAMANPANGHTIWDSYERQQLMQGLFADLELTLSMKEVKIEVESEDVEINITKQQ